MSTIVCLCAKTLDYPEGGGHLWVYLNWALGLRALDCRVIWLEQADPGRPAEWVQTRVGSLKSRLAPYGLADDVALCSLTDEPLPREASAGCLDLDAASEALVLLDIEYDMMPEVVKRFRRSALLDIDPGLLQTWMSKGSVGIAPHDLYFTIGETVGEAHARFPDVGVRWQYTPPCVALPWWPSCAAPEDAPFTTVAHWFASSWIDDESGPGDKRSGFLPFLDLPSRTSQSLELAVNLGGSKEEWAVRERAALVQRRWRVREAHDVASTPWDYQRYIGDSRGEFSCAKPSCIRFQNAWVSDRTLCYLASGKPAVVQHTGPSRFLPDSAGIFRFHTLDDAVRCLEAVAADYERQCGLARALAEEYFDARKVAARILERMLA